MAHETPLFSFVIPVRNQCRELTLFLFELHRYFESRSETFEVVVVDDGSRDQTSFVVQKLARDFSTISLQKKTTSHGLGVAAREGMLRSRGAFVVLVRPQASFRILDQLFSNFSSDFRGVLFGQAPLRSSFWPPALFALGVWRLFDWFFGRFVPGGLFPRFSPLIFSREVGEEVARVGRVAHAGYQLELVFLAKGQGKSVLLMPLAEPFVVEGLPIFYFLTVTKELVKLGIRSWGK